MDHWLSEYSKVKEQLSDLESTLDDLAKQQRGYRALDIDEVSLSLQQDQDRSSWPVNVVPESGVKADEMIWLASIADGADAPSMVAAEPWNESETAQWTLGVGWYQNFECSDSADANAVISQSPPIVIAAATTSDLVLDAARSIDKDQPQSPINGSVSYVIVAVSIASWQVSQRRKRPNEARQKERR